MIKINFSSAISVYLSFSISLVFVLWIFYNLRRNGILNETKYLHQCPYCTHMFFNYNLKAEASKSAYPEEKEEEAGKSHDKKTRALICPRCQSYIHLENHNQEKKS